MRFRDALKKPIVWVMAVLVAPLLVFALTLTSSDAVLDMEGTTVGLTALSNNNMRLSLAGTGRLIANLASGSVELPVSNPAEGTAATTIAGSGTIDTTQLWQRVTDAGAVTGIIMEAGTEHGQLAILSVDKDASGTLTMAAESTSNVCAGTTVVLAAGEMAMFIWDATDTCWAGFQT